ncbi:MAG: electron transfer flavoprotein subunit alpha/FixB family protein, partial [Mycobacteriaceae bacterium]
MTEVLVLVEHADGELKKVTAELITAARALGEPSAVVIGAPGTAGSFVDDLTAAGAEKIYIAESDDVDGYFVTPKVDVLAALVASAGPAAVLAAATVEGKEVAGRLAVRVGSGLLTDVVGVAADGSVTQSVFGGAFSVTAKAST